MLEHQICVNISRVGIHKHMMRCVGIIGGGVISWLNEEVKEAVSRKMHTRRCVRRVLRRIRVGINAI